MYKGLYDNFAHWFHDGKGQVYFYSDPHFSDKEMIGLRNITDEEQVKRINSKIGRYDTLVILGDIGNVEWVKNIRGYKVLVCGNHDSGASNYVRGIWGEDGEKGRFIKMDNHLFDEVYEGALIISEKLILSHEPLDFPYAINIHGHVHSLKYKDDEMHCNVCAEHVNYTPVCLKHIIESGKLKNVSNIHRETIDEATKRKKKRENKKKK